MNKILSWKILPGAIASLLISMSAFADNSINGIWSSTERTKGGLGSQWVFTNTGHVTYTFGALVDFTYTITNNTLTTTLLGADSDSTNNVTVQNFSLQDDTLTIHEAGQDTVMKRASPKKADKHPIVGDWTYMHKTGGAAMMRYRATGTAQFSLPFETRTGIYFLEKDKISISITGKKAFNCQINAEGNKITFSNPGKDEDTKYIKLSP